MMTLNEFVARAVGVPFKPRGRDWNGWDCWGCVVLSFHEILGIELPSYEDQYEDDDVRGSARLGELVAAQLGEWAVVPLNRDASRPYTFAKPMDVAVFRLHGRPLHTGLVLDQARMLHTEHKIGTVIERLSSPMWAKRLEGIYRRSV